MDEQNHSHAWGWKSSTEGPRANQRDYWKGSHGDPSERWAWLDHSAGTAGGEKWSGSGCVWKGKPTGSLGTLDVGSERKKNTFFQDDSSPCSLPVPALLGSYLLVAALWLRVEGCGVVSGVSICLVEHSVSIQANFSCGNLPLSVHCAVFMCISGGSQRKIKSCLVQMIFLFKDSSYFIIFYYKIDYGRWIFLWWMVPIQLKFKSTSADSLKIIVFIFSIGCTWMVVQNFNLIQVLIYHSSAFIRTGFGITN